MPDLRVGMRLRLTAYAFLLYWLIEVQGERISDDQYIC